MLTKRIIPCLDVMNGRTVKGINFLNLKDAGDAVELGKAYAAQGADELVFLDITATLEERGTFTGLVKKVAEGINIPFTVGGGIHSKEDVSILLNTGADKIAVNTAAVLDPGLVDSLAREFGSQCIVVAVDTRRHPEGDRVHIRGGRTATEKETRAWVKEVQDRGAGEILLTSMDHDGTKNGFAIDLTAEISGSLSIPVIASGGAGTMEHFSDVFKQGKADAALAASIFHYGEIGIRQLKVFLQSRMIPVRI